MEDDPDGDFAALEAPVTGFDAFTGFADLTALDAFSAYDAVIDPDLSSTKSYISEHQSDVKNIVDGLLTLPPSASLGRIPTS